jgi:hypothetical protein
VDDLDNSDDDDKRDVDDADDAGGGQMARWVPISSLQIFLVCKI